MLSHNNKLAKKRQINEKKKNTKKNDIPVGSFDRAEFESFGIYDLQNNEVIDIGINGRYNIWGIILKNAYILNIFFFSNKKFKFSEEL